VINVILLWNISSRDSLSLLLSHREWIEDLLSIFRLNEKFRNKFLKELYTEDICSDKITLFNLSKLQTCTQQLFNLQLILSNICRNALSLFSNFFLKLVKITWKWCLHIFYEQTFSSTCFFSHELRTYCCMLQMQKLEKKSLK
jgi:hypothetical protein